jgi:hypothetical protein
MSWTVFTVAHRIVCKDKNRWQLHQGREPDGRPRVITEDEEACAVGPKF